MINATKTMIAAVREVPKARRYSAMLLAEKVFFEHYAVFRADPETWATETDEECIEMAGAIAASEVAYRFAY